MEQAIVALLTYGTVEKAADATGISLRTLHRWRENPEFRAAFLQAKQDAFSQSTTRLQRGSDAMATVLLKLALDPNTPPSVRVHAADRALAHARNGTALEAIATRAAESETDDDLSPTPHVELLGVVRDTVEHTVPGQREALVSPPQPNAVAACRAESDGLQEFFEDRCVVALSGDAESWRREKCWVRVADLYPAYVAGAANGGHTHLMSKRVFEGRLHGLGRGKVRVRLDGGRKSKHVWVWLGIRLQVAEDD